MLYFAAPLGHLVHDVIQFGAEGFDQLLDACFFVFCECFVDFGFHGLAIVDGSEAWSALGIYQENALCLCFGSQCLMVAN